MRSDPRFWPLRSCNCSVGNFQILSDICAKMSEINGPSKPALWAIGACTTLLPFLVILFLLQATIGLSNVKAWLKDEAISVQPTVLEFSDSAPIKILVRNLRSTQLTVSGIEASCSCVKADGLPLKLNPYESGNLSISVGDVTVKDRGATFTFRLICNGKSSECAILLNPKM